MAEQDKNIEEMTSAQQSLQPQNRTKSDLLAQMMRMAAGMKKQDLSSFLTKTLDQVGKEDDKVADTSSKNKQSVSMHTTPPPKPEEIKNYSSAAMKEDVAEMFEGQEDLTEDFVNKASTLFEAAVSNRVSLIEAEMEERVDQLVEERVTESVDELHQQLESYIDYVADKWIEENKVELETNYRTEFSEQFLNGLHKLFKEHYVDVPEDQVDVVEELKTEREELIERLETIESDNIRLNSLIEEARQEAAFDEIAEGLVDTQVDKFRELAEGVDYEDIDDYTSKLKTIRESYFDNKGKETSKTTGLIDEEQSVGSNDVDEDERQVVPEGMQHYVSAISNTVKK